MYSLIRTLVLIGVLLALAVLADKKYTAFLDGELDIPYFAPKLRVSGTEPATIKRDADNMLVTTVNINNHLTDAYIDTGAPYITLGPAVPEKLSLDAPLQISEPDPQFGHRTSHLSSAHVAVGELLVSKLPLMAKDTLQPRDKTLLGMSYLKHFDFHYANGKFTLFPAGQLTLDWLDEAMLTIPLSGERYYATLTINDHPVKMIVDTGASLTSIDQDKATAIGLQNTATYETLTALGKLEEGYADSDSLQATLGDLRFTHLHLGISSPLFSDYIDDSEGLLGQDILQYLEYAQIDQTLYIRPTQQALRAMAQHDQISINRILPHGQFGLVFSEFQTSLSPAEQLCFPGTLNGYESKFRLDTSFDGVMANEVLAYRAGLRQLREKANAHPHRFFVEPSTLTVSGLTISNIPVTVAANISARNDCYPVGRSFWEHLDFTLDQGQLMFTTIGRSKPLLPTTKPHAIFPLIRNDLAKNPYNRHRFTTSGSVEGMPIEFSINLGSYETYVSPEMAEHLQPWKKSGRPNRRLSPGAFQVNGVTATIGSLRWPLTYLASQKRLAPNEIELGIEFIEHLVAGKRGDSLILID